MSKNYKDYEYQKLRSIKRKLYFIEKLGGKCFKCSYSKNIAALDFHHLNEKAFSLDSRNMSNKSIDSLENEANKCILLCANCHREEHYPEHTIDKLTLTKEDLESRLFKTKKKPKKLCIDCNIEILRTSTRCRKCSDTFKTKNNKPSKDILYEEIEKLGVCGTGRKYNVSHGTIRRWINKYNECALSLIGKASNS